jgi:hypothetical protein
MDDPKPSTIRSVLKVLGFASLSPAYKGRDEPTRHDGTRPGRPLLQHDQMVWQLVGISRAGREVLGQQ